VSISLASSRRSVSWCVARKTASEKLEEKKHFSPVFSLAIFRATPQLTERLEEATISQVTEICLVFELIELMKRVRF